MARLFNTTGGSNKFWEGEVSAKELTTRWGAVGTKGQSKAEGFESAAAAKIALEKKIKEKLGKGYVAAADEAPAKGLREPAPTAAGPGDDSLIGRVISKLRADGGGSGFGCDACEKPRPLAANELAKLTLPGGEPRDWGWLLRARSGSSARPRLRNRHERAIGDSSTVRRNLDVQDALSHLENVTREALGHRWRNRVRSPDSIRRCELREEPDRQPLSRGVGLLDACPMHLLVHQARMCGRVERRLQTELPVPHSWKLHLFASYPSVCSRRARLRGTRELYEGRPMRCAGGRMHLFGRGMQKDPKLQSRRKLLREPCGMHRRE